MNIKKQKPTDTIESASTIGTPDYKDRAGDRHMQAHDEFVRHVLESESESSVKLRRAAAYNDGLPQHLMKLVEKIHKHSYKVVDEDIDVARTEYSEDEIFEIILSACVGASEQRILAGLRAAEEAK